MLENSKNIQNFCGIFFVVAAFIFLENVLQEMCL